MGDQASVVLCHGFTSSPATLGYWADGLRAGGCRVAVPRLPGHDTTWQQLNRTGWQDWYARVERELLDLHSVLGRPIFVGGLSMGGALALRLAQRHPQLVAGLLLVNPCVLLDDPRLRLLPVLRRMRASIPGIASDIAKPGVAEFAYDRTPLHALASSLEVVRRRRATAVCGHRPGDRLPLTPGSCGAAPQRRASAHRGLQSQRHGRETAEQLPRRHDGP